MSANDVAKKQAKLAKLGGIKELGARVANREKHASKKEVDQVDVYLQLPIDDIISLKQVRRTFRRIQELSETIESNGLEQPIHVLPKNSDGKYVIAKGERRYRAVKLLNWDEIPVIIQEGYSSESTRIISQLVENIQRDDLPPCETAEALIELRNGGMNGIEIAKHIGKSESFVSKHIAFIEKSPKYIIDLAEKEIVLDIQALNLFRKLHDIAPERAKLLAEKSLTQGEMSRGEVNRVFDSVKEELDNKHSESEQTTKAETREYQENIESTGDGEYETINTISVDPGAGEGDVGADPDPVESNIDLCQGAGETEDGTDTDTSLVKTEKPETEESSKPKQQFDSEECFPGSGLITKVNVITSGKSKAGILLLGVSETTTDHVWVKLDGSDIPERFKVSQINLVAVERIKKSVEQAV